MSILLKHKGLRSGDFIEQMDGLIKLLSAKHVRIVPGTSACTDGKETIYLPWLPNDATEEDFLKFFNFAVHEQAHFYGKSIVKAMSKNRTIHMFQNAVDDIRCEYLQEQEYPGLVQYRRPFYALVLREFISETLSSATKSNITSFVLALGKYMIIKIRKDQLEAHDIEIPASAELIETYNKYVADLEKRICKAKTFKEACDIAQTIYDRIKDMIREEMEKRTPPPPKPEPKPEPEDKDESDDTRGDDSGDDSGHEESGCPEEDKDTSAESESGDAGSDSGDPDETGEDPDSSPEESFAGDGETEKDGDEEVCDSSPDDSESGEEGDNSSDSSDGDEGESSDSDAGDSSDERCDTDTEDESGSDNTDPEESEENDSERSDDRPESSDESDSDGDSEESDSKGSGKEDGDTSDGDPDDGDPDDGDPDNQDNDGEPSDKNDSSDEHEGTEEDTEDKDSPSEGGTSDGDGDEDAPTDTSDVDGERDEGSDERGNENSSENPESEDINSGRSEENKGEDSSSEEDTSTIEKDASSGSENNSYSIENDRNDAHSSEDKECEEESSDSSADDSGGEREPFSEGDRSDHTRSDKTNEGEEIDDSEHNKDEDDSSPADSEDGDSTSSGSTEEDESETDPSSDEHGEDREPGEEAHVEVDTEAAKETETPEEADPDEPDPLGEHEKAMAEYREMIIRAVQEALENLERDGTPMDIMTKVVEDINASVKGPSGPYMVSPSVVDVISYNREGTQATAEAVRNAGITLLGAKGSRIATIFVDQSRPKHIYNQRAGRFDPISFLADPMDRRNDIYADKLGAKLDKCAVSFMMDNSSSMSGVIGVAYAILSAMLHYLSKANIPTEAVGFTAGTASSNMYRDVPVYLSIVKKFEEPYSGKVLRRSVPPKYLNQNAEVDCLRYMVPRLWARPEKKKVLFIIGDGMPCIGPEILNLKLARAYKEYVELCRMAGILVFGFGIDCDLSWIFGKDFASVDSADMGEVILKKLTEILSRPKGWYKLKRVAA